MIHLLDIDPGNWRIDLAVSEAQKPFVSDRAKLLARAYAYRARRSRAFLICADDLPVGMGALLRRAGAAKLRSEPDVHRCAVSGARVRQSSGTGDFGRAEGGRPVRQSHPLLHRGKRNRAKTLRELRLCGNRPRRGRDRHAAAAQRAPLCKGRWRGA